MNMKRIKKELSLFLCTVLIVAMALVTTGCSDNTKNENAANGQTTSATEMTSTTETTSADEAVLEDAEAAVLGEGNTVFNFTVVDKDGNESRFEIHTDKTVVGEALLDLGLIAGEESQYGLFVKSVNGIIADYDVDGTYWAFYVNGEYAQAGVDSTTIAAGESYSFKVEK